MKFLIAFQYLVILILICAVILIEMEKPEPRSMTEGDLQVFQYLLTTGVAQGAHIRASEHYFAAIGEVINLDEVIAKDYGDVPMPAGKKDKLCHKQLSLLKNLNLERQSSLK